MSAKQCFYFRIDDLANVEGEDSEFAFKGSGIDALCVEFQRGLRDADLFERWRSKQEDPDAVPESLAPFDPDAVVTGQADDLHTDVEVQTTLTHLVVAHRLTLLIGRHWTLRDVGAC